MFDGKHRLNIHKNSNWRDVFYGLPETETYLQELLQILSGIVGDIDSKSFIEKVQSINDFSIRNDVKSRILEIIDQEVGSAYYRTIISEQAKKLHIPPVSTQREKVSDRDVKTIKLKPGMDTKDTIKHRYHLIKSRLESFRKMKLDISEIQGDVYSQVESLIFDSDMRYLSLLWELIRLGIPLQSRLISAISEMPIVEGDFQNDIEKKVFYLAKQKFPHCFKNVFLGGKGGIEMDIYISEGKKVNIEIDSLNSPKGKVGKKRDDFLKKHFEIQVFRLEYNKVLQDSNMHQVFTDAQSYIYSS